MRKSIALMLAVVLCISVFALVGCKKNDKATSGPEGYKEKYGYEAYVADDAEILGAWVENISDDSKSDKTVWHFESTTTLNIVESVDGHNLTEGCAYNFNDKTNELSYFFLDRKKEVKVSVEFDGENMTFTDENGQIVKSFTKQ